MRYFSRRIAKVAAAILLALGLGSLFLASPAHASSATQLCTGSQCLNAWNGGPAVNTETPGASNNNFQLTQDDDGDQAIQYIGSGAHKGECIGDYGNSSSDARVGLSSDCVSGSVAWGTNLIRYSCSGGYAFYDSHWGGWLGPQTSGTDKAFYLNKPTEYCFSYTDF